MGHDHSAHEEHHVVPNSTFAKVLGALLVLTVITVAVSRVDFGVLNIVVAMVIASIKAALVIAIFMHGMYENKLIWTYILLPFVLLVILIAGVFLDNPFRDSPQPIGGLPVEQTHSAAPTH